VVFATRYDVILSADEIKEAAIAEKTEEWMIRSEHDSVAQVGSPSRCAQCWLMLRSVRGET
jgi:hypothetical protein